MDASMYSATVSLDLGEPGFVIFEMEYAEFGTLTLRLDREKMDALGPQGFSHALFSMWQSFPSVFDASISAAAGETTLDPGSVIGEGILVMGSRKLDSTRGES